MDIFKKPKGPFQRPSLGISVEESIGRLQSHCRVPVNESEEDRSNRRELILFELIELFSSEELKTKKGLADLFRFVDNKINRPVLVAMREYLRMELGGMELEMGSHLKKHLHFEPALYEEMQLLRECEISLARPLSASPMSPEEVKRSLRGSCVIPQGELKGYGFRHVDNEWGDLVYHVSHATCAEAL
jgi:hypothetical protein